MKKGEFKNKILKFFTKRNVLIICTVLVAITVFAVVFVPPRLACADNGDFSRFAERIGISGYMNWAAQDNGETDRFFVRAFEDWPWRPINWEAMTPKTPSFSNIYLVNLIRGATNIVSDTAETDFSTAYLAFLYCLLTILAFYMILKFLLSKFKKAFPLIFAAVVLIFLSSMHLAFFNSFYGEAVMYVGLLLLIGCTLECISAPRSSLRGRLMTLAVSLMSFFFVMSKPQNAVAFPIWIIVTAILTVWHLHGFLGEIRGKKRVRTAVTSAVLVCTVFMTLWTSVSCIEFYKWNSELVEKDTLYSSLMTGLLNMSEDPEKVCLELGLDPILTEDIGKTAYGADAWLTTPPRTELAEERIYSKVNTFDILGYYLKHPAYLWEAMDITASYARSPATELQLTIGEKPSHDARLPIWEEVREYAVPSNFLGYVIVYGLIFIWCIAYLIKKKSGVSRLLVLLFMAIMLTGILQYPLPYIGNGLADTNKQLYLFMLTYDITMVTAICFVIPKTVLWIKEKICQRHSLAK